MVGRQKQACLYLRTVTQQLSNDHVVNFYDFVISNHRWLLEQLLLRILIAQMDRLFSLCRFNIA
jgi:hypothetical protein